MLRSTLLKLSESKGFANWVTSNGTTRRMARRFVAGETLDEAIAAARECNNAGMFASLDYLGENCLPLFSRCATFSRCLSRDFRTYRSGRAARQCFQPKLTQLGLDINIEFCEGLLAPSSNAPPSFDNFSCAFDMEGSP